MRYQSVSFSPIFLIYDFEKGRYRSGKLGWHIGAKQYMFIPFNKHGAEVTFESDIVYTDSDQYHLDHA